MSKVIIWDVDEVLANLREVMCGPVARHMGLTSVTHWKEWDDYHGSHKYFGDRGNPPLIQALLESNAIELAEPEEYAREALQLTHQSGFRNICVTARGWHPGGKYLTQDWFVKFGMDSFIEDIHLVPENGRKNETISKFGKIAYYIEDSPLHCFDAATKCQVDKIIVMNRPWNINSLTILAMKNAVRVNDLQEFCTIFKQDQK